MSGYRRFILAAVLCGSLLAFTGSGEAKFIPGLDRVLSDDGEIYRVGCITGDAQIRSRACRFGHRNSKKKVVLLGDSHAAQWGPALLRLARKRDWRLIVLTRASCPAALVNIEDYCNAWRKNSLDRIRDIRPGLVIVASAADRDHYLLRRSGDRLSRRSSEKPLTHGMETTLRMLKRWSAKTVLIRNQSAAPFGVTACLRKNRSRPHNCGFRSRRSMRLSYDFKASRKVGGIRVIDPQSLLCPDRVCHSVDGRYLIYRSPGHLSASFVRKQAGWLGRKLEDPWSAEGQDPAPEIDHPLGRPYPQEIQFSRSRSSLGDPAS